MLWLFLLSCGWFSAGEPVPAPDRAAALRLAPQGAAPPVDPEARPRTWTEDEARAAFPLGTTWAYRTVDPKGMPGVQRYEVTEVRDDGVSITSYRVLEDGSEEPGDTNTESWKRLGQREHAFCKLGRPSGVTTIEVPAGRFASRGCVREQQPPGKPASTLRQWFSDALPMRAVRFELVSDGATIIEMSLLKPEHTEADAP